MLTMAETVELATEAMRSGKRLQHVALNVAKFVNMRSDPVLHADVVGSDLIGIDGMGVVLAARWLGLPVRERVTGIDLFGEILAVCAKEGFRPYLLGATPSVLQRTCDAIVARFPSIKIAGANDGYFRSDKEAVIVEQVANSGADCLFIGMPTPKKERFLGSYRDHLGIPFIMGVGGAFDVFAGQITRAPNFIQSMGLEWLYRVYQEPRRMWWRYARTNTLFAAILIDATIRRDRYPRGVSRVGSRGSVSE
jgi:N-acetylglucosaminyldiphosphoundecaprenol N-acetyl-beta-D-mannosaminyltransferase